MWLFDDLTYQAEPQRVLDEQLKLLLSSLGKQVESQKIGLHTSR